MLVKGYKIVQPKRFEIYMEELKLNKNEALVKIETATICKADIRYYIGAREERILGLKYPMNLIHEAVGRIVKDPSGKFQVGDKVTLVPNLVLNCNEENCSLGLNICKNKKLGCNYCPKAKFASSNYNGFSREYISYPINNLVLIPEKIQNKIGVFSELISVALSSIRRINISDESNIGIWGDGILGYVLASIIKTLYNCKVLIVGKHKEKLSIFPLDNVKLIENDFDEKIDIAFECVGGNGAESAINNIIDVINPGGTIVLTGVSEKKVGIDTRRILEKGLMLCGVTRSNVQDFKNAVALFENKDFCTYISKLCLEQKEIKSIKDFYDTFECELNNTYLGKYIMNFNI